MNKNYQTIIFVLLGLLFVLSCEKNSNTEVPKPNFLLLMADNQYYNHLSCYGDPVVKTPNIDQLAASGVRFTNAFCASPSCTPARGALLAGQDIWRLGEGANLWSTLSASIPLYTDLLEAAGYYVGHDRKGWGPGDYKADGRTRNPAGYTHQDFDTFLTANNSDKPWSFWLSSRNPHRPFVHGAGVASGMDPSMVAVPPYLPDVPEVRADICDYYYQIQAFDQEVEAAIALLKEKSLFENTVIIVCADNGWMMPRGLANLYDFGTRVPLIITYPKQFKSDRVISDFVNLNDLAPTILELAGLTVPEVMTAQSLNPILNSDQAGRIEVNRDFIVVGRERHAICRQGGLGYPGRAIRTDSFLLIQNITPERWPAGDPPLFGDIDLHMLQDKCPTKEYMMVHKEDSTVQALYEQAFLKRPAEELFDLISDPFQMNNLAEEPAYQQIKAALKQQLHDYLVATADPRASKQAVTWDSNRYFKEADWIGKPRQEAQEKLGLKEAYPYR